MDSSQQTAQNGDGDDDVTGGDDPRIAELEELVAALTEQVAKLTDLAARAQADLQNAKLRLEKEAEESRRFAGASVMIRMLPLIDNLQRAFQHLPADLKDHEWVKGIAVVEQNFLKQAGEMGLRKIESLGQQVDTAKHDVVTVGPGKEGEIIEVFEDGYELNGKILRPAKVKVGDGSEG